MPRGVTPPEKRCGAINKRGVACANAGLPMVQPPRCRWHGGYTPAVQAKAAEYAKQYELGLVEPFDPPEVRRYKINAYHSMLQCIERRRMKKAGILEDWERAAGIEPKSKPEPKKPVVEKAEPPKTPTSTPSPAGRSDLDYLRQQADADHEEARARGLLPPKPEPQKFLRYPVREAKERRRREYSEEHARKQAELGDRLPGGGIAYSDMAPVPADAYSDPYASPISPGPIPFDGFDLGTDADWAETMGLRESRRSFLPEAFDPEEPGF